MEIVCKNCGALVDEHNTTCQVCGKPMKSALPLNINWREISVYTYGALILSVLILLLSFITAVVDSATFINHMYTTVLEWNLPLAAIALAVAAFVTSQREHKNQLLNIVAVAMLGVAFICSNPSKNMVQDHASNLGNYVEVAAEVIRDDAENVFQWSEDVQKAVVDAEEEITKALKKQSRVGSFRLDFDDLW